eukprot:COSAG01_NODE_2653_length_7307_cov_31.893868_4_plen_222_part_00
MAVEPRNLSDFQYSTLANVEVLAVFKDTSGFSDIAMIGDGSPAATAATRRHDAQGNSPCNVTMLSQRDPGDHQCVAGKTFGCDHDPHNEAAAATMWVSGQCRGLFACAGAPSVVCEAWSGERASCPCVTSQVWTRPLDNGTAAAVALFNPTATVLNATIEFSQVNGLDWIASTQLVVRDLWAHQRLATGVSGNFTCEVAPHGTRLLRVDKHNNVIQPLDSM